MKVDILAIGVHPDDVELSCSGTLLKHLEEGENGRVIGFDERRVRHARKCRN